MGVNLPALLRLSSHTKNADLCLAGNEEMDPKESLLAHSSFPIKHWSEKPVTQIDLFDEQVQTNQSPKTVL